MVNDATPFATLAVPIPENVTVPVAAAGVTTAVKVTAWPCTDGFVLLEIAVAVDALATFTVMDGDELPL